MGRHGVVETASTLSQQQKQASYGEASKLAWGSTALSLASLMLLTDSADAQQSSGALPTIQVNPPQRAKQKQSRPQRVVRPAPAPGPAAPAAPTQTEATGPGTGYQTPAQSGISRVATPLINTPQTVNVVPQQLIQDQRASTLAEALRNVPGITFTAGEGGIQGDNLTIRGYTARNDIFRDGIRDPGWYNRDTFSIDRVEVLKGPSSFLFGRGSTGGIVNLVTKTPQNRTFVEVEATGNTGPGMRATLDANAKFNETFAARFAAVAQDYDSPGRDFANTKRVGIAPSVAAKVTDQLKVTTSYVMQHEESVPDRGIVLLPGSYFGTAYRQPAPVPRNTYYGAMRAPFNDIEITNAHILNNKIEYDITNDIKFTNTTGYSYVDRFNRTRPVQLSNLGTPTSNLWTAQVGGTQLATPGNPLLPSRPLTSVWVANTNQFQNSTINQLFTNQSDLVAKFSTGPLQHTLLVGMEVGHEQRDNERINITGAERINLGAPNAYPTNPGALASTAALTNSTADVFGVYASDQIKVTEWLELLGGVRYDDYSATQRTSTVTRATGAETAIVNLSSKNEFTSYRVGVVVHPLPDTSLYVMHGTSANPPAEFTTITNGVQSFDPVQSEVYEAGFKADLLNKRLNVSAAVFQIKKSNDYENRGTTAAPDYVAIGTTQVRGFEIGVTGRLTDKWSIYGGYTYLMSEVLSSFTAANVGHELAQTPKNSFSVWTTYDVTPDITLGGGAFYVDDRWTGVANDGLVPNYWRFDAMAAYKVNRNFTLALNVYNIADTTNYESLAGAGFAVPGPGRYFALSGRARF